MIDGIIKDNGTSRRIRATFPGTYEEFKTKASSGDLLMDVLFNADGWSQLPDFLGSETLLKEATAALLGLDKTAVPDDALRKLRGKIQSVQWGLVDTIERTGGKYTEGADGVFTWTAPDLFDGEEYELGVYMIGGGGSGGLGAFIASTWTGYANGGAAGFAKNILLKVTPGQAISAVVGAGGIAPSGVSEATQGNAGGSTSFNGETVLGGEGGAATRVQSLNYLRGAKGGQNSCDFAGTMINNYSGTNNYYINIDNSFTQGGSISTILNHGTSVGYGALDYAFDIALSPRITQNAFDGSMVTLSCGGASWSCNDTSAGGSPVQQIPPLPDGTKGGDGSNLYTAGPNDATGYGNGGGAHVTVVGINAASGAGAPGVIFVYARRLVA